MSLCDICHGLFDSMEFELARFEKGIVADHHSTIASFVRAADLGCFFCHQASQGFDSACRQSLKLLLSLFPVEERPTKGALHATFAELGPNRGLFFTRFYITYSKGMLQVYMILTKQYKSRLETQGLFTDDVARIWPSVEEHLVGADFNLQFAFVADSSK
jgi:hypothetical protein